MRIWSLHPKYLDQKGLVALWRETLLAQHVLAGKTKGYKNHPQLNRFKETDQPLACINQYLAAVYEEATARGYNFSKEKIDWKFKAASITVTKGQVDYEWEHLLNKLKVRDKEKLKELSSVRTPQLHPIFSKVAGKIEDWEIIK
jgi:hypothetical protein